MANAFIVLQKNDESRSIVEAVHADNPNAVIDEQPVLVKIDAPGKLVIRRQTIEGLLGRPFDLRELQLHLITISGNLDESDDEFILSWSN